MPSEAEWRERAERFSARVRDAIEIYGESAPALPHSPEDGRITYHDSVPRAGTARASRSSRAAR